MKDDIADGRCRDRYRPTIDLAPLVSRDAGREEEVQRPTEVTDPVAMAVTVTATAAILEHRSILRDNHMG